MLRFIVIGWRKERGVDRGEIPLLNTDMFASVSKCCNVLRDIVKFFRLYENSRKI